METAETAMNAESIAAVVTWVLNTLATPFVEKVKNVAKNKMEIHRWKGATEDYLNGILRDYGTVRVLGHPDMPLDNIFTDVYILDRPTAERRYNMEQLQEQGIDLFRLLGEPRRDSLERRKGIGLVTQGHNLYILGKPGAGKTTFMKYIATEAAQHRFLQKLPIFVSLHEWTNSKQPDLFSFIVQEFDTCGFPHAREFVVYLLAQGKGLLLFDGLDEVRKEGEQRDQVILQLKSFIRKYHRSQYLITCRVAASEYRFDRFWDVEVADFTQDQIEAYAEKRFRRSPDKYEAFVKAIGEEQHKAVRELCNTPLLLSLVSLYFEDNTSFPQRRSEIYADALEILLRKWDNQRNKQRDVIFYGKLSTQRKKQMLARIATPAFEAGHYFLEKEALGRQIADYLSKLPGIQQAAEDIDGEEVLQEIAAQHGLLVERASNIYSFSHLTFQEYFTAQYIVKNEARGRTKALITDHLNDQRWREVFFLVASMLEDGDDFCHLMGSEIAASLNQHANVKEMIIWSQARTQAADPADDQQVAVRLGYASLALARDLDRALDLALALARALDLDLAKNVNIYLGLDYGLYYIWVISAIFARRKTDQYQKEKDTYVKNFTQIFELCEMAGCDELSKSLHDITIPKAGLSSSPASWQKVADRLAELMLAHRDLRMDWSLDRADIKALRDYYNANELLVRCLDLAFVSDRQGFKNGLLLPPGEEQAA